VLILTIVEERKEERNIIVITCNSRSIMIKEIKHIREVYKAKHKLRFNIKTTKIILCDNSPITLSGRVSFKN